MPVSMPRPGVPSASESPTTSTDDSDAHRPATVMAAREVTSSRVDESQGLARSRPANAFWSGGNASDALGTTVVGSVG